MQRRHLLGLSALAATGLYDTTAWASEWPQRPVKIIVPYAPGGVTDLALRMISKLMEADLGASVVIENKPGANGTLGATQMITTAPDGYQLSVVPVGIFRQPHIERMALDPLKHLTFITQLIDYSYVIAVRNDAPWKTVADFVAHAKRSGGVTFGTPGMYSTPHLTMEDFAQAAGFKATHIPYKSAAETTTALMGGHIDAAVQSGGGSMDAQVEQGRLRLLVTLGEQREKTYPNVPTLKEAGFPIIAAGPFGLVGPAGMDPKVVARIDASVKKALADAELQAVLTKNSASSLYMNPATYLDYARRTAAIEKTRMTKLQGAR